MLVQDAPLPEDGERRLACDPEPEGVELQEIGDHRRVVEDDLGLDHHLGQRRADDAGDLHLAAAEAGDAVRKLARGHEVHAGADRSLVGVLRMLDPRHLGQRRVAARGLYIDHEVVGADHDELGIEIEAHARDGRPVGVVGCRRRPEAG